MSKGGRKKRANNRRKKHGIKKKRLPAPMEWLQGTLIGTPILCLTRLARWQVHVAEQNQREQERQAKEATKRAKIEAAKLAKEERLRQKRLRRRRKQAAKKRRLAEIAAAKQKAGERSLKVGCITRKSLKDGRPYPAALAAQQFNPKHCQLIDDRLQEIATEGVLFLGSTVLNGESCFALLKYVQKVVLPEIYDSTSAPAKRAATAATKRAQASAERSAQRVKMRDAG